MGWTKRQGAATVIRSRKASIVKELDTLLGNWKHTSNPQERVVLVLELHRALRALHHTDHMLGTIPSEEECSLYTLPLLETIHAWRLTNEEVPK